MSPVLIPTLSKDLDELFKMAQNVVDIVDRANRKTCVTLLRYSVEKAEASFARVHLFAKKKEDEKNHQTVYVKHKIGEFIHLVDVVFYI